MKWFLFFHDGYFEDGDLGLRIFDSEKEALENIEERLEMADSSLSDYTLIYGRKLTLLPQKTIIKIQPEPYL